MVDYQLTLTNDKFLCFNITNKYQKSVVYAMASSYLNENEAPRDFKVSSTESDGHYKKCLLCYTVKRNFYCPDCIRAGNFVHSSMPYADRCVLSPQLRSSINERLNLTLSDYVKRNSGRMSWLLNDGLLRLPFDLSHHMRRIYVNNAEVVFV